MLRLVGQTSDRFRIQVPGGLSGWIAESLVKVEESFVVIDAADVPIYSDVQATILLTKLAKGSRLQNPPG